MLIYIRGWLKYQLVLIEALDIMFQLTPQSHKEVDLNVASRKIAVYNKNICIKHKIIASEVEQVVKKQITFQFYHKLN